MEECVATHLANGFGNRLALVFIAVGNDGSRAILRKEDGGCLSIPEAAPVIIATLPSNDFVILPLCRSGEHTSELQSLMRISYAVFCLKQKKTTNNKK